MNWRSVSSLMKRYLSGSHVQYNTVLVLGSVYLIHIQSCVMLFGLNAFNEEISQEGLRGNHPDEYINCSKRCSLFFEVG